MICFKNIHVKEKLVPLFSTSWVVGLFLTSHDSREENELIIGRDI